MARTSIATDDFNRTDGALGANWASLNGDWGDCTISGNQLLGGAGDGNGKESSARWVGTGTFTDDQYSSLKIIAIIYQTSSYRIGVIARASGDTNANRDYYMVEVYNEADVGNPRTTVLSKVVNGTRTELHSATVVWAANDLVSIECEGTTIRALKNGVLITGFEETDSDITTGSPGVTGMGSGAGAFGDDWEGGNLGAAPGGGWIYDIGVTL